MKQLVITADDFGAADEVNQAVEQAHLHGILSAASLMMGAPATQNAVQLGHALPSLRIGLHLVLVEGRPVLPPDQIPALVDQSGHFRRDMAVLGSQLFFLPAPRAQMEAEIEAQFKAFATTGLTLDHVNAHKHFHLHPSIANAILRIGPAYGMKALRIPYEPPLANIPVTWPGRLAGYFARRLMRRCHGQGLITPDQVYGLSLSGRMTGPCLQDVLHHLPEGLTEIYLHPATAPYPGSAPGYGYKAELDGLTAPDSHTVLQKSGAKLGGFRDFN